MELMYLAEVAESFNNSRVAPVDMLVATTCTLPSQAVI